MAFFRNKSFRNDFRFEQTVHKLSLLQRNYTKIKCKLFSILPPVKSESKFRKIIYGTVSLRWLVDSYAILYRGEIRYSPFSTHYKFLPSVFSPNSITSLAIMMFERKK